MPPAFAFASPHAGVLDLLWSITVVKPFASLLLLVTLA